MGVGALFEVAEVVVGPGLEEDVVTGVADGDGLLAAPEVVEPRPPQPASTAQRARMIAKRDTGDRSASELIRTCGARQSCCRQKRIAGTSHRFGYNASELRMNSVQLLESTASKARGTFRNRLLAWYDLNRRDLPWRKTGDPYRIWVSEIMLQQTRVAAVLEHYRRFFERFPTVSSLARAREQSVLAAWSGLGYYRRARNLHAAAKVIVSQYDGIVPKTAVQLRELPGIGRYTAAAIASIAFGEPVAVVDGNVERVLQRVTGNSNLGNIETWQLAESLVSPRRPGDFNQAMMELGATVCLPREPKCLACPIIKFCDTRGAHRKSEAAVRKTASVAYAINRQNGSVWLVQRPKDANLMAGMWELPEVRDDNRSKPFASLKHSILDTTFAVSVYERTGSTGRGHWIKRERLARLPLTGLARKILRHAALL
jgi:A/G-specific adenine glycosylase